MINLLPPQYKEELRQERNFRMILILTVTFLFFLISLILILFSVKFYIQSQADALEILISAEEKTIKKADATELNSKITEANKKIKNLLLFYEKQPNLVSLIEKIFQALPQGVNLTSLSWQKESGQVVLSGFSPSREILFELKSNLEATEEFTEVFFPPQNWIKPNNIDFQATFKVK